MCFSRRIVLYVIITGCKLPRTISYATLTEASCCRGCYYIGSLYLRLFLCMGQKSPAICKVQIDSLHPRCQFYFVLPLRCGVHNLVKTSTSQGKHAIQLTAWMQLADLNIADDLALRLEIGGRHQQNE